MTGEACTSCEGWGKDCDLCRVGIPEDRSKEPTIKEESIGELLIAAFSEDSLF